jgi:hypothetical protein
MRAVTMEIMAFWVAMSCILENKTPSSSTQLVPSASFLLGLLFYPEYVPSKCRLFLNYMALQNRILCSSTVNFSRRILPHEGSW